MLKLCSLILLIPMALCSASPENKNPWYNKANHGPAFYQTYGDWENNQYRPNSALKGLALFYSTDPRKVALFNTETLSLVSATDQGLALDNTPWRGRHGRQNKFLNKSEALFTNTDGPVWTDAEGSFTDTRPHSPHGNLSYAKYNGHFRHNSRVILDYTVHDAHILESISEHPKGGLVRYLEVSPHKTNLVVRLSSAQHAPNDFYLNSTNEGPAIKKEQNGTQLHLPATNETTLITVHYAAEPSTKEDTPKPLPLSAVCHGGPPIYPETFKVNGETDSGKGPWLIDTIPLPPSLKDSPYHNKVRTTDFDFFSDGDRAAVCTWDGDVWIVSGLSSFGQMTWKRFATGLFEPLGLRIVDDIIHVSARDAIWQLHDLNGDLECDHYEIFNNDILITNSFHEFSFGLETDSAGNFYFSKAGPVRAGGRGFDKILPHNGTVMRLSKDGTKLDVIATGIRAAGGIGVGPNGEITTGENEGTWQPVCKLNYFTQEQIPAFLGVEDLAHDLKGQPLHEPLCYFPHHIDNSGGGQVWIPPHAKIGLRPGELLHLSYGKSSINRVLTQPTSNGHLQGGIAKLPIKLQSSAQRAAFHPDGSMYAIGMRGWQTNAPTKAAFHRVRFKEGATNPLPDSLEVHEGKITIRFEHTLDEELANDPTSYTIKKWKYIRSVQYGSGEFSIDNPDLERERIAYKRPSKGHKQHDTVEVTKATLQADEKSIVLECANLTTAQQVTMDYDLEGLDGALLAGKLIFTIHELP